MAVLKLNKYKVKIVKRTKTKAYKTIEIKTKLL